MVMKSMNTLKEKFSKFAKPLEKKIPSKHSGTPSTPRSPLESSPFDKSHKKDQW